MKQFKQLLLTVMLVLIITPLIAQVNHKTSVSKNKTTVSSQLKEFIHLAAQANVSFMFPKGFKEIKAPNNEDFSFDYALELPRQDFEIWFQVKSEKENWASYVNSQNKQTAQLAHPDSLYNDIGAATATAFTGDKNYFIRELPQRVLARYNADAGKSYLLTLLDLTETKHYKYALLITLHKNHIGTIMAVCFTNDKGPEFFKNMDQASDCIKFKS